MSESVAEQCRKMGLKVGDTIEGTERGQDWFVTTRLTLLWLGKTSAVFRVTSRGTGHPYWSDPVEETVWDLRYRDWRKVL